MQNTYENVGRLNKTMFCKNKNGITLVALVITIIILLILAGITINSIIQSNLIENAKWSKWISEYGSIEEAERIYENSKILEKMYEENIEKEYGITSEKVIPTSTLKQTIEKIHGEGYEPDLYKLDLEKIGIKNKLNEYVLDKKDGKIYYLKRT